MKRDLDPALALPADFTGRLLLHVCCATCCGVIIETLHAAGLGFAVYFYNPNIHPRDEYDRRKADVVRYCDKKGIVYYDGDYDDDAWRRAVTGHEQDPERGGRCSLCFGMRMRRSAQFAHDNGFGLLATSLGISRWKNLDQVNAAGHKAVQDFADVGYWDFNWRKDGRADRRFAIAKEEGFYQQDYCGCSFSRAARDARAKDKGPL